MVPNVQRQIHRCDFPARLRPLTYRTSLLAFAYKSAAAAHPSANATTFAVIRPSRARAASFLSIMIWVVAPVMRVVGGGHRRYR